MDSRSFDRLARLMGEATDRRAGLKAALGLLLGGAAADAAAKDRRGKHRDRKRGEKDLAGVDAAPAPAPDATPDTGAAPEADKRKKRRCKPVGGKCKKDKRCCSGACTKPNNNKGKPAKKGVCACRGLGLTCLTTADCCAIDGYQLQCTDGTCERREIATGQVCVEGDACIDPEAACVSYQRDDRTQRRGRGARDHAATLCLVGGGGACVKDQDCISLECSGGVCLGDVLVPMGDACVPGQTVCRGRNATCSPYDVGSGGPGGYYCVYPKDARCDSDVVCAAFVCDGGTCGRNPIETGEVCDPRVDTCRNAKAACTTPTAGDDPAYRCLLGAGETCSGNGQCISQACAGTCQGGPALIDLGQACAAGQRCRDGRASCTAYRAQGAPTGTFCLLPDLDRCAQSSHCEVNSCLDQQCTAREVPTGDPCNPATQICLEQSAACEAYAPGSGGDNGPHCLLGNGLACTADRQCKSNQCVDSRCTAAPAPTGEECDTLAGCAVEDAVCTVYEAPGISVAEHCVLPRGFDCTRDADCETYFCGEGVCTDPVDCIANGGGTQCEQDSDCCAGTCQVTGGIGRCIGPGQVWFRLSWEDEGTGDLDSWLWMPESTAPSPRYEENFPEGGDVVDWHARTYPEWDYSGDEDLPEGTEVWLDVDKTSGPGVERTLILIPRRNGRYRFAVKNYTQCSRDEGYDEEEERWVYSEDACGPEWAGLSEDARPLAATDARVDLFRGDVLIASFARPAAGQPEDHYYWWHVADVRFDAAGNFAGHVPGGGAAGTGTLRTCAPIPYPMADVYALELANYCPVS